MDGSVKRKDVVRSCGTKDLPFSMIVDMVHRASFFHPDAFTSSHYCNFHRSLFVLSVC
jgi:hypothetical protein